MQAKTESDSLSLNEITFIQKTNFLLDPLWRWIPYKMQRQFFMIKFNVVLF